jgi:Rrf2 family transcriptional regulator, nitric oxide-sensitive transcriptional repressor
MRLTLHTDYALRLLIYIATRPDAMCAVNEVARAYQLSHNHLVKVAQTLRDIGLVETSRGRAGGIRLAQPLAAFLSVLDRYTLADVMQNRAALGPLLGIETAAA